MLVRVLNKFIFYLKNIFLPIAFVVTLYIVMFMFKRLGKEMLGADLIEFLEVIAPFVLLFILNILNIFLHQDEVKNNLFYNVTSIIVIITIFYFCFRSLFDQNMFLWHEYSYNINFNYFADQLAAVKIMLYGLSVGNILLMLANYIKTDEKKINE